MLFLATYCNVFFAGVLKRQCWKTKGGHNDCLKKFMPWRYGLVWVCVYVCFCVLSQPAFGVCFVTYLSIITSLPRLILWACLVKNVEHLENCNMFKLAFSFSLNLLKYLTNLSKNSAKLNSSMFNNASCLRFLFLL